MDFYAHTLKDQPPSEWQNLRDHLEGVAKLAEGFAEAFGAGPWGRLAGLWHDIGKYSAAFQDYLKTVTCPDSHIADRATKTDHSTAGAQLAVATDGILGHLLAYVIAGHHSGLHDGRGPGACLEARLGKIIEPWAEGAGKLATQEMPPLPEILGQALAARDPFAIAFFTRMLFSCLVDADFLETEAFMDPERAAARPRWAEGILDRMAHALDRYVEGLASGAASHVDRQRTAVRRACLASARLSPGLFSLTVPTGGGKTLSSLAFALRHAIEHDLDRVIYVVPFTTIIEQNADAFRKALAGLADDHGHSAWLVEHHSNLDMGKETVASRLATENWDAPLIVTTSVQFYESLFANRTSRCRKLHNLARAVIVLDEVQTLPVDYLEPCLRALTQLTKSYGSTVVLCTATQPAVEQRETFDIGLESVREIVHEPHRLYENLRRVRVEDLGPLDDETLVRQLHESGQVLCIVNTRGHARKLFQALGENDGHFHLSASMCPEHRTAQLARIRQRLEDGAICRVVSTQLIEAGVDIDFPVVYRSLAGLDSIAQAAGRCNRRGLLPEKGQVFVFRSQHTLSERFFADTVGCAGQLLPLYEDDPLSLKAVEHYFRLYYWEQNDRWDSQGILGRFALLPKEPELPFAFGFHCAAKNFRLIEDSGQPVIVPWGKEGRTLCERLRECRATPDRALLRRLQRYTVSIPKGIHRRHVGNSIQLVHDRYPVLVSPETHYSETLGLLLDGDQQPFLEG